mmetsp:Transcript_23900/g.66797  ORF Transcript_23900/g.66797 Transcript_23900/m.66797 type:complete len:98 (-) Transcript_23900:41-334(-)
MPTSVGKHRRSSRCRWQVNQTGSTLLPKLVRTCTYQCDDEQMILTVMDMPNVTSTTESQAAQQVLTTPAVTTKATTTTEDKDKNETMGTDERASMEM